MHGGSRAGKTGGLSLTTPARTLQFEKGEIVCGPSLAAPGETFRRILVATYRYR
jgi:hypothetical protein